MIIFDRKNWDYLVYLLKEENGSTDEYEVRITKEQLKAINEMFDLVGKKKNFIFTYCKEGGIFNGK